MRHFLIGTVVESGSSLGVERRKGAANCGGGGLGGDILWLFAEIEKTKGKKMKLGTRSRFN